MKDDLLLKIALLYEAVKPPERNNDNDCGLDVFAPYDFGVYAGGRVIVNLGIVVEFPDDYMLLMQGRSGLGHKHGIFTIGNVIDPGYRGELHCSVVNSSKEDYSFEQYDRIAQLVLVSAPVPQVKYVKLEDLAPSSRGNKGFGSSGR